MSASSPMKPVVQKGRLKIYRASKGVHTYPGLHLWIGRGFGHLRFWPLPPRLIR